MLRGYVILILEDNKFCRSDAHAMRRCQPELIIHKEKEKVRKTIRSGLVIHEPSSRFTHAELVCHTCNEHKPIVPVTRNDPR